jgi:flagellar biogenesis protein FliO
MCHPSHKLRRRALALAIWPCLFFCGSILAADAPGYPQNPRAVQQPTAPSAVGANPNSGVAPNNGVAQAAYTEPGRLPSDANPTHKPLALPGASAQSAGEKMSSGPHTLGAIVTVVVSLGIVLGLFAGCAWLMRRGLPNTAKTLPADAVSVLGRAPLASRQQMHLVRFGNKMLLVCVSPSGVDSLGEITDPAEIDRLAGICEQQQATSATAAFKQIFGQVARGPSPAGWFAPKSAAAKEARDV